MSNRRRRYKEWEVVDILLLQGAIIICPQCKQPITDARNIMREHVQQLGPDGEWGEDTVENCQYWHKTPCSHEKTYGTKATSAGSDAHVRAKHRRLTGKNKPKFKRKIPSRPLQTNKDQGWRKPLHGNAVRRIT